MEQNEYLILEKKIELLKSIADKAFTQRQIIINNPDDYSTLGEEQLLIEGADTIIFSCIEVIKDLTLSLNEIKND